MINKLLGVLLFTFSISQVYAVSGLQDDLDEFIESHIEQPRERKQESLHERSTKEIRGTGILEQAINVGDYAPEFKLMNAVGKEVSLYDALITGPVVLVWYRGGWCPYCNLQLKTIQDKLTEIMQAGGQVIAISPELPDKTMTLKERHSLEFNVLSDINNRVADTYKLAYNVPDSYVDHYDLSYTLNEHNGADSQQRLPLAATYVIDKSGIVEYAFLDADFVKRADPDEVIAILNDLKNR